MQRNHTALVISMGCRKRKDRLIIKNSFMRAILTPFIIPGHYVKTCISLPNTNAIRCGATTVGALIMIFTFPYCIHIRATFNQQLSDPFCMESRNIMKWCSPILQYKKVLVSSLFASCTNCILSYVCIYVCSTFATQLTSAPFSISLLINVKNSSSCIAGKLLTAQ